VDKNIESYNSAQVVNWYNNLHELLPVEKKVFELYSANLTNASLLDIGIGGGRTTLFLLSRCKEYTGIDYSEKFVELCKKKFPEANILKEDARDLSLFKTNEFDFVNFSFNGIDYVSLSDRIKIISEVQRILKPGGIFFFSSHNLKHSSFNKFPWQNGQDNLYTKFKTFVKLLPFVSRKFRHSKAELITRDYAIINDSAHNYSLLTFYSSPSFINQQLSDAGFGNINFYKKTGDKCSSENCDDWIFVTCEKA